MKILVIADGRSPITARWMESIRQLNVQIVLVSTYPCKRPETAESFYVLPVAFSRYAASKASKIQSNPEISAAQSPSAPKQAVKRFRNILLKVRYLLGPLTVLWYHHRLRRIIQETAPDVVHALRIPFEGMLGMATSKGIPFVVSIWGNDLTLHAQGSLMMRWMTRQTLKRADGLFSDTARDIRLARLWGLDGKKPAVEVPGNGGISFSDIRTVAAEGASSLYWLPGDHPVIINPRGFRPGSVRNDTFFKSIPLILSQFPDAIFLCCSMENQPEAQMWVEKLQLEKSVILLPTLKQADLWPLFMRAQVTMSISQHDGTPNSLLEAMSLGCFPVVGDIESMREWITPGVNGMLVDAGDPEAAAQAVVTALKHDELRERAAEVNAELIRSRAESSYVVPQVGVFYRNLMG